MGLNCDTYGDFCHHPLKQGFDFFYGVPLTNLRNFGDDEHELIDQASKRFPWLWPGLYAYVVGVITILFTVWWNNGLSTFKLGLLLLLLLAPAAIFRNILLHFANIKQNEGIVMRNYDIVQQPINLTRFTHRLVREAHDFLRLRHDDRQPFLLVVPWIQVHTALHSSELFRGHSAHGRFGDEIREMDWSVGQVIKSLDMFGMTNNTLVYFTSDNGGHVEEMLYNEFGPQGGWNGDFSGNGIVLELTCS